MMKPILLFPLLVASSIAFGQVGIGTTSPNTHAVLDLRSPGNNQGLLVPTLTTAQRTAAALTGSLGPQDNGLLVYDSDDKKFYFWMDILWQPVLSGAVSGAGTVTDVDTGTGLTGGPISSAGVISLANTAVTSGTYGSPTAVGQFTVDAQGRITNASTVTISGVAPTGTAGGDLTGSYPNPTIAANAVDVSNIAAGDYSSKINTGTYPISITGNATTATAATNFSGSLGGDVTGSQGATTVAKLQGSAVSAVAPATNQILKWTGIAWAPAADANSGGTVTNIATGTGLSGGPITATGTISLANTAVTAATYGDATHVSQIAVDAQGRITNASSVTITGAAPTGSAGGDLTGNFPNPTIAANAVNASKIAAGDYSTKINTGTYSIGISGNAATATTATNFSGSLGGDVTGTQAATTVTKLQGSSVSATAPATNQILKWTGTAWAPAADANSGGTVTNIATGTGLGGGPITATGTISLANTAVTAGTYGDATHVSQVVVDAQGRITNASSVTITGAAPTGAASGDLTGNYPNPTIAASSGNDVVAAVNNAATTSGIAVSKVSPSATNGQVLTTVAGATAWANANAGTVTNIATGTGLTGGPITGTGTIALANTAVTAATYGDATHVSQIAVDAQGRITNASSVTITGAAPTGAAGGDLAGNFPNPTIATGSGNDVVTAVNNAATTSTINTNRLNTSVVLDSESPVGGDIAGDFAAGLQINAGSVTTTEILDGTIATADVANTAVTDAKIATGITVSKLSPSASNGQVLTTVAGATAWANANAGTVTNIATGTGLTGGPITATGTISLANTAVTAATYGDATHVSQIAVDAQGRITNASSVTITGAAPTGSAGGDLTGNYPNPTIAANAVNASKIAAGDYSTKINTGTYSISISGNAATATTATNFSGSLGGDVTGSQGATTVAKLQGSAVSATAPATNQILKWTGTTWAPAADANSGGTVTNIATGTGLSGGPITATGTISLANTAVTAATYGDATHVSQIAVDAQGRITNASSVTITGAAPTGAAGGDLTGNYPNPTLAAASGNDIAAAVNNAATTSTINTNRLNASVVLDSESPLGGDIAGDFAAGLQINAGSVTTTEILDGTIATADVANTAVTDAKIASGITVSKLSPSATNGQVLTTVAGTTAWANANAGTVTNIATGTGLTGGPITATGTISLANTAVTAATYGDATHVSQIAVDAQGRITNASSVTITGAAPTGAAGGDLTGNYPNPTIAANAINASKIAAGDYSTKINAGTYSIGISGNAATATTATNFSGSLGGDVTGSQGATTVAKLQGSSVSATAPATNQILKWTGTAWAPAADANSGGTVTNIATGTGLSGGPITATGTISLANTAVTAATYGDATHVSQIAVDAQGRITNASSVAITGGPPTGTAGGDLTGTYPNPTVTTGAITSTKILDGTIVDADISTTAAIVDSKLNTISTAGKVSGNAITSGTISGTTAVNTSGSITTTTGVTASNATAATTITASNTSTGTVITATANTGTGISAQTANVNGGYGVFGQGSGQTVGRTTTYSYGVYGSNAFGGAYGYLGGPNGAYGNNINGNGVFGTGYNGVVGVAPLVGGFIGVNGSASADGSYGVYGVSSGNNAWGVYGSGTGAGSYGVYSQGQAGGTTTWVAASDMRFKKNIETVSNALAKILQLRGVRYDWRVEEFPTRNFSKRRDIGVIAQEINQVLPEVVVRNPDGYFSVSYEKIVPVLIEAMKEQQTIIDDQKAKIEKLQKLEGEMDALKAKISGIEALLSNNNKQETERSKESKSEK